jgi:hypothetical protein
MNDTMSCFNRQKREFPQSNRRSKKIPSTVASIGSLARRSSMWDPYELDFVQRIASRHAWPLAFIP